MWTTRIVRKNGTGWTTTTTTNELLETYFKHVIRIHSNSISFVLCLCTRQSFRSKSRRDWLKPISEPLDYHCILYTPPLYWIVLHGLRSPLLCITYYIVFYRVNQQYLISKITYIQHGLPRIAWISSYVQCFFLLINYHRPQYEQFVFVCSQVINFAWLCGALQLHHMHTRNEWIRSNYLRVIPVRCRRSFVHILKGVHSQLSLAYAFLCRILHAHFWFLTLFKKGLTLAASCALSTKSPPCCVCVCEYANYRRIIIIDNNNNWEFAEMCHSKFLNNQPNNPRALLSPSAALHSATPLNYCLHSCTASFCSADE